MFEKFGWAATNGQSCNEEVRRRAVIERKLASRAHPRVLRSFGHVERIEEYRMASKVLMSNAGEGRVQGWPRLG